MDRKTNLRTMKVDTDSGVKQTFNATAKTTDAERQKNETVEYKTPNLPKGGGSLGGRNSDT